MYMLRIDVKGGQQIQPPVDDEGILMLGRNVLKAEEALPADRRFPRLDLLQQHLTAAQTGLQKFEAGKTGQSSVSVTVESAQADANAAVQKIISGLKYHHLHELPVLEQWGIDIVKGPRGAQTRTPRKQADVLKMLKTYIEKEETVSIADRLPAPPLTEVQAIRAALVEALEQRTTAETLREQGVLTRTAESAVLYNLLQLVAHYHIMIDFDGVVDARLQTIGFTIVAVPPKALKPAKPSAEEPPAPTA